MKKEDFICPCCGLPNHLEFESIADYNEIRNLSEAAQDSFIGDGKGNVFNNYIINEDNKEKIGEELTKKFKKIKSISNKYIEDSFKNWFDKNVVCFIKSKEDNNIWLGSSLYV